MAKPVSIIAQDEASGTAFVAATEKLSTRLYEFWLTLVTLSVSDPVPTNEWENMWYTAS